MALSAKEKRDLENLTWRYVDDEIDERQFKRLEAMLLEHDDARRQYVECMILHAHLHQYFRDQARAGDEAKPRDVRIANDTFLSQLLEGTPGAPQEAPEKPAREKPARQRATRSGKRS